MEKCSLWCCEPSKIIKKHPKNFGFWWILWKLIENYLFKKSVLQISLQQIWNLSSKGNNGLPYQPSGERATRSPSATLHRLFNPKWLTGFGNNLSPMLFDPPLQFWLNKCFVSIIPKNLKNSKWPHGGPKMTDGVWKGVYFQILGRCCQLLLNNVFDPSAPSMRKGCDG